MNGKRIYDLEGLSIAAQNRRSVVVPTWGGFMKPRPAVFVFNMIGSILIRMFASGMYIYEKEK